MTAKGCFFATIGIFALGVTIAISLMIYQGGITMIEKIEDWLPWMAAVFSSVLIILLGIMIWYVINNLRFRLRHKAALADRAKARVNDFTATGRGFAPRLLGDKIINPNIVPSAITPLEAVESSKEISEERRLAGVMGWHLSNAPGPVGRISQRAALPIPEPQPSPWQVSHVEKLLLEAGEARDVDAE